MRMPLTFFVLLFSTALAVAQQTPAAPPPPTPEQVFAREFGQEMKPAAEFAVLYADFDNDGVEDAAMVSTGDNPLARAAGLNYKVLDPYDDYFGWGNPKLTSNFNSDPTPKFILVIFSWRAATPKAKFVLVNVPFKKLTLGSVSYKKNKTVASLTAEEHGGLTAAVYWDSKRWKWEPLGM